MLALAGSLLGERLDERDVTILVLVLAVAVYGPLRGWLGAGVRRLLFGRRGDRYDVVSAFAARLEETRTVDEQLPALAAAVASTFKVPLRARRGAHPRRGSLSAAHGVPRADSHEIDIAYRGERIGSLVLPVTGLRAMLSRRDQGLLVDLVRQAAIAIRSSLLAEEVQESRERLVLGREDDRRRIRRDLHDGLGPALGGVAMRLDAAGNAVDTDPERARELVRLARTEVRDALDDVRRLVHDLRPPALDDLGLTAALEQQAERVRPEVDVTVRADGARRAAGRGRGGGLPDRLRGAHQRGEARRRAARRGRPGARRRGPRAWRCVDDGRGIGEDSRPGWACCRCASGPRSSVDGARSPAPTAAGRGSGPGCRSGEAAATRERRGRSTTMSESIRVMIADDHPVFRDGLASLLEPLPGIEVVARATDGAEAVALAAEHRPDVIVMDVQMPEVNGIEATRRIVAAAGDVGILVITMGEDDGTVLSALRAGARGYLRKGAEQDEIVRAIVTVHGGGVVFGASLAARIAEVLAPAARPERPFPELTERETEILDLIAAGPQQRADRQPSSTSRRRRSATT